MDTLRDNFDALGGGSSDGAYDDEAVHESPPPQISQDERRMQVRAYNFWAGLLDDRNYPRIDDLDPDSLPDFGPNGVLLDFSRGTEDPAIAFLGAGLAEECGANGLAIERLSDVPARSLLSRITDHYMQILANQAPIGFEAEFINQRGATILYRGILLPFSSDDSTIDFIFGVINWKELADAQSADELLLEIDQALEEPTPRQKVRKADLPMGDWADGPGAIVDTMPAAEELPRPSFGLDLSAPVAVPANDFTTEQEDFDPAAMDLAAWLASARELAQAACSAEDRTRNALYDAISRAYDFSLAAESAPQEFRAMVEEAGLTMQDRAPMTPVVKLVFGADYDKTRLTEYAAALTHAHRQGLACGDLADYLRNAEGGLKGVVQAERQMRRAESGKPVEQDLHGPRPVLARKLRALDPLPIDAISRDGEEFALVMVRRTQNGDVVLLGEVDEDRTLIEKAARILLG